MPNTKGAYIIYTKFISKLFKKYEKQIDDIDNQFQSNAKILIGGVEENLPDKDKMNNLGNMANNLNNLNNNLNSNNNIDQTGKDPNANLNAKM